MINFGIISDIKKGFAKVYFEGENLVTDWLPVLHRKSKTDVESWQLEIDEHVAVLMDDRFEDGVILGAIHSDADKPDSGEGPGLFRKKFSDGTVIQFDKNSSELKIDTPGKIIANALEAEITAPSIKIVAMSMVEITAPQMNLTGNVTVAGALSAASIATTGGGAVTGSGDLTITGKISTTGEIQGGTIKAGLIDLAEHKHVASSGGGPTSPPTP